MLKKCTIDNAVEFGEAEVGDTFWLVTYKRYSREVSDCTLNEVIRVGKRDIVYVQKGTVIPAKRVNKLRVRLYNAYLTKDEVCWALDEIRVSNKRHEVYGFLFDKKGINKLTEDVLDQVLDFQKRLAEQGEV